MVPANEGQQYDGLKIGIALLACVGVLLVGLTLVNQVNSGLFPVDYQATAVAEQSRYDNNQVIAASSWRGIAEPQPTIVSKRISDDGKQYVVKALARTEGMASCRFDAVDDTIFADGGAQSTHAEGTYVRSSGTYVYYMSEGESYEWLYLPGKTYRKDARGKWLPVPPPQLPHGIPTPSKGETQAGPQPSRIPMWDITNLDDYQFGPAYEETQGPTKVIHVAGKAAAQGTATGESTLDVWLDSATGYLYMFATGQDLNVGAQKDHWAVTSSNHSATAADWRTIAQLKQRVVLKNVDGYDNVLPTP
jgi:hypothetical protein